MTKLKKIVGVALALAMLALATPASAASITNVEFQNGQTTVEGLGGSTVTANFRVVVGAGEVVEQIQTDVIGDSLAPVCTSVGGELGLQQGTHSVALPIKLPQNTGTHTLDVQGSGIFGGFRADDCVGDVVGSASFSGALRVVSTSSSSSSTSTTSQWDALMAMLTALIAKLNAPPPAPASSPLCTQFSTYSYLHYGSHGSQGLQTFLIQNGYSIPAGPTGYYGPQTASAVASFQAVNHCN